MASGASADKAPEPKTGNLDDSKVNTNQQGVVLRYFCGRQRFGLTWLGPAYRQKSKEVKSGSGKGGGAATGHDYYADCAGLACLGPVDALEEVWMDDERVWPDHAGDQAERSDAHPDSFPVTLKKRGVMTIYWGTETQGIDPLLAPQGHPAYRGQCYVVFNQLHFGQDRTTPPNVELVCRREAAAIPGLNTEQDWDSDVHPPFPMAELLTNPRYGMGWDPATTLDLPAWEAAAARLRAEEVAISPLIDQESSARELMTKLCEYFDGYLCTGADGMTLALRLARAPAGDLSAIPLIGEYELLEPPDVSSQNWHETFNEITVQFTDRDQKYQSDAEPWRNLASRRAVGVPLSQSLDRAWFTRREQAARAAAYAGRLFGVPWVESQNLQVRREAVDGVGAGDFIRLTYADWTETLLMRVLRRKVSADRAQAVELEVRSDRYYADVLPFTPDQPPLPDNPAALPHPALAAQIIEVPYGLVPAGQDAQSPTLAALASRASALDVRWRLYTSEAGDTYDEALDDTPHWAISGTLAAALPAGVVLDDGADGILVDLPGPDGPADLETTDERGRLRMRLLVFLGEEIIAYRDADLVSATRVRLRGLRRGCYDTLSRGHPAGEPLFILRRKYLPRFSSSAYRPGDNLLAKVMTSTALTDLDLTDAPVLNLPLVGRAAVPLPALNLRVNGRAAGATWPGGQDVLLEWDNASWVRNRFFNHWEDAYFDPLLKTKLRIFDADGVTLRRRVKLDAGVGSFVYPNADLVADFGGGEPARFIVQVCNKYRGVRSLPLQITVNRV